MNDKLRSIIPCTASATQEYSTMLYTFLNPFLKLLSTRIRLCASQVCRVYWYFFTYKKQIKIKIAKSKFQNDFSWGGGGGCIPKNCDQTIHVRIVGHANAGHKVIRGRGHAPPEI